MRTRGPYFRLYATPTLIKVLMTLRGVTTNKQLAASANVTIETTRRFTSGEMIDTSGDNADKLATALRVETGLLFVPLRTSVNLEELAA